MKKSRYLIFLLFCISLVGWEQQKRSTYVLGPEDQIEITALDVQEIGARPLRVDLQGGVNIPLIGRVEAGGRTVEQLEAEIAQRLQKFVREPEVTIQIKEFRSQPVSVLGAVNKPGVHQLQGRKTLFEMLSMAEGLRNDAGDNIKITRQRVWGNIPLPGVTIDAANTFSVAEVSVKSVMEAQNPEENIEIMPNDVISVPRAALVYVVGTVRKSGAFVLSEKKAISTVQAIALAEGFERGAEPSRARIFRPSKKGDRVEIPIDLSKVLSGKTQDIPLYADDILYVPNNAIKMAGRRALESALQLGIGVAIWRF